MYNRWYDIADEGGMLLQDEWQFWGTTGTKKQIEAEFLDWIRDNWNHPSIVTCDPLNESSDEVVQQEIVPMMKSIDPTRPWESHDFYEDHPYIYSLGPVLIDRKFGYSRSLDEIRDSQFPSQVNEYLWWWLDKENVPSELTRKVVGRWLGAEYTSRELVEHQSFLATELTELFRRMRVRCIQLFVYISANAGSTSHWFLGDIAEARPKPVLDALKNAFEPFGVSIELWDRHFLPGEKRILGIYIFNDYPTESVGRLKIGIKNNLEDWISLKDIVARVPASTTNVEELAVMLPENSGDYYFSAELTDSRTGRASLSKKIAHVYERPLPPPIIKSASVAIIDEDFELIDFLDSLSIQSNRFKNSIDLNADVLIVVGNSIYKDVYRNSREDIEKWVAAGHTVIFTEPERGLEHSSTAVLPVGRVLTVERRSDVDKGGYDSCLIQEDHRSQLWDGIRRVDLRLFNGGYGGEIIPQSDMRVEGEYVALARSGLELKRVGILEYRSGKGKVIVSSVELGGRLSGKEVKNLFDRRHDPVACKFLLNLITYALTEGKSY